VRLTRRALLARMGALAGAGLLAAHTPAAVAAPGFRPSSQQVKLSVWKAPHNPQDQEFWDGQLATYMKSHPNVSVEFRVTPWDTWHETYTAAFAGDNPPDISYIVDSFFAKYADAGSLVALDSLEGADLSRWEPLFDPSIWAKGHRGGKQYGLPFIQIGISYVWNKRAFREAGFDPDTPPKTWEELKTVYAPKLTRKDASGQVTQWGYGIMDNTTGEMLNFVPVPIVNYGGEFTTPDDKQWVANTPEHAAGLQLQIDMIHSDRTAPPLGTFVGHDLDKAFLDGKVATYLSYAAFLLPLLKDYPDFEMGISMPPAGPKNDLSLGGVGYWMMASKSQHKAEAWELMQYLASPEVTTATVQLTKLFPCRTDISPFAGDPIMEGFARTQRNYMRFPVLPFDFWGILMPELEAALTGQRGAQEALDTAARRINDQIQKGS